MRILLIATLAALLAATTTAAALTWWMPLQEVRLHSYVQTDGAPVPRYQWRYVQDVRGTGACVLILTDLETGHFAITDVPEETCQ